MKVYEALIEAGQEFGIGDFGIYAMNVMRLEHGFRMWGAEVSEKSSFYARILVGKCNYEQGKVNKKAFQSNAMNRATLGSPYRE